MSYAGGAALQEALYDCLSAALAVPVFDAIPSGVAPITYVLIGPEQVRDASDQSGEGAEHRLMVSVVSRAPGFAEAKAVAVAVSDALTGASLALSRGALVGIWFLRAEAKRLDNGAIRRVDLSFRARLDAV